MRYALLFGGQALNFLIAVINIRASARGLIGATMASDFVFCFVNYLMIHRIAEAVSLGEMTAYACGGACGSALAILVSRRWDTPKRTEVS